MATTTNKTKKSTKTKKFISINPLDLFKKKETKGYMALFIAVAFAYFSFGAITNVAGAIIPKIRETYAVSSSLSSFLAAVFFVAYGLTSIPWGMYMEANGKKGTLMLSSAITTAGVALFAAVPGFGMNMLAMFLCGIGITGVQVAINPLVSEISDPAKYSRNLTLFMVLNGLGGYAAPQIVTLIKSQGLHWTTTYWVFTAIALVMLAAISLPEYPSEKKGIIEKISDKFTELKHGGKNLTLELLSSKPLIYLYALGIFLYVGVEVGVANTIAFYLEDKLHISMLMGDSAEAVKNTVISNYWGGLLLGRLLGSAVLDKVPGRVAIQSYIALAAVSLYLAMSGGIAQAQWAFPLVGFFISIMFPTIYSIATNNFPKDYAGSVSAVLCTAIIGGAVIGPAIAAVAELTQGAAAVPNWDAGLTVAFVCYAYIFVLGMVAKEKV